MRAHGVFEELWSHSVHKERDLNFTGFLTGTCTFRISLYRDQGVESNYYGGRARGSSGFVTRVVEQFG